ncbi:hypothetical protein Tco_1184691 [Tanacetum coccineum]
MLIYYDPEGDILILGHFSTMIIASTNPKGEYSPEFKKILSCPNQRNLQVEYATSYEPKVEIPEVKLKELPPHLRIIDPRSFATQNLLEDDYQPSGCNIQEEGLTLKSTTRCIRKEGEKTCLVAGIGLSPIVMSPWGSPVHCVLKSQADHRLKHTMEENAPPWLSRTSQTVSLRTIKFRDRVDACDSGSLQQNC